MTSVAINNVSVKFGLTIHIVKSWCEHLSFNSEQEAEAFFEENIDIIKAKPFIKWV